MSICLNLKDKAVQNLIEEVGIDRARAMAEAVAFDLPIFEDINGKLVQSELYEELRKKTGDPHEAFNKYLDTFTKDVETDEVFLQAPELLGKETTDDVQNAIISKLAEKGRVVRGITNKQSVLHKFRDKWYVTRGVRDRTPGADTLENQNIKILNTLKEATEKFYRTTPFNLIRNPVGVAMEVQFDEDGLQDIAEQRNRVYKQLYSETEPTDPKLNNKMLNWLKSSGFTVKNMESLQDELGVDANASIDLMNEVMMYAEGKLKIDTLPEEVSHAALIMMRGTKEYQILMDEIEDTETYEQVVRDYSDLYKGNKNKLKEEAIAKELAGRIVQEFKKDEKAPSRFTSYLRSLWNKFINSFRRSDKDLFDEVLRERAKDILVEEGIEIDNKKIGKNSQFYQTERNLDKLEGILGSALKVTAKRIQFYTEKGQKKYGEKQAVLLRQLIALYDTKATNLGIKNFLQSAHTELTRIEERISELEQQIKDGEITQRDAANVLREMKMFTNSYMPIVEKVRGELRGGKLGTGEEYKLLNDIVNDISSGISYVNDTYIEQGKKVFADTLRPFIGSQTDTTIEAIIEEADRDINFWDRWVKGMAEGSDDLLKIIHEVVRNQKETARLRTIELWQDLVEAKRKLEAAGVKDTAWMYERNKGGEVTGNYISEFNMDQFQRAKNAQETKIFKKIREMNKGIELSDSNDKLRTQIEGNPVLEKQSKQLWAEWFADNTQPGKSNLPADKYKSDLFVDNPDVKKYPFGKLKDEGKQEFYDLIRRTKKELDDYLPPDYRDDFRAPQIRKDTIERIADITKGDVTQLGRAGQVVREGFYKVEDDTQFGGKVIAATDVEDNEVRFLPIHYTSKMENNLDLSIDTIASLTEYASMANNYNQMNEVVDVLEIGKDIVAQRAFKQTNSKGDIKRSVAKIAGFSTSTELKTHGIHGKAYARLIDYYNMMLYGETAKKDEKLSKTIDTFNRYTGLVSLAVNVFSGVNNVVIGGIQTRIEAFAGEYFNNKDLLYADATYTKNIGGVLSDVGNRDKVNKLSLWALKANVLQDYESDVRGLKGEMRTKFGQLMNSDLLFILQHGGEHYMQIRTSLAAANNVKLQDKDGKEINLYDAYEVVGNKLVLKEGVAKPDGSEFTERDFIAFTGRQDFINQRLHGIYNVIDRNALQQYAMGRMGMMFRKYIVPSLNRRFETRRYNYKGQTYTEGYYRTVGNFIKKMYTELKQGQFALLANYDQLTDAQKANFARAMTEYAYFLGTGILIMAIGMLDDGKEDDLWIVDMMAYQVNRVYTELGMFTPSFATPKEVITIIKHPVAGINSAQNLIDLMSFWNWFEKIERGRYEGKIKLQRSVAKSSPIYDNILKVMSPEEQLIYFKH